MQDHLGSTVGSVDTSGTTVSTISYAAFGGLRDATGTSPTDMKFTGQRLDTTGLYYYNARYYDPGIGRFISADTIVQDIHIPQTLNRYSYCLNNPLRYIDPTGHEGEDARTYDYDSGPPPDYDTYINEFKNGNKVSYSDWKNSKNSNLPLDTSPTVFLTTPSPSLPASSTTIIKTESFKTAIPVVSGIETLIINYGWEDDTLTVAIAANTKIELEADPYNKVTGSVGASVYVDNIEYKIYLKHPDHPVIMARNSTQQEGQRTIFNVQEGAQVTLTISLGIRTNGGWDQPSAASFTQPLGGSWTYVINR